MNKKIRFLPFLPFSYHVCLASILFKAILIASVLLLPILIGCGAVNVQQQIETAINEGDVARLHSVIQENPSYEGVTLIKAIESGRLDIVKSLIFGGVAVNAGTTPRSMTPLMHAAMHGQNEIVQFLIDQGADVNRACECFVILPETVVRPKGTKHIEYDLTFRQEGHDALTYAIKNGHKTTVELLLKHGSNHARKFITNEANNGKFVRFITLRRASQRGASRFTVIISESLWFQVKEFNDDNVWHVATTIKFEMQSYSTPIEYARGLGYDNIVNSLENR